jgi:hypothetical protein
LATPNYGYEKRQRELAKKRKAEEKKQKKLQGGGAGEPDHHTGGDLPADSPTSSDTPPTPAAS